MALAKFTSIRWIRSCTCSVLLAALISCSSVANVSAVPVITRHPNSNGNITVADGTNVRLWCEATGNGTLAYQWRRVSGSLPRSASVRKDLLIRSITILDSGQYYCVVSDNDGSVSSMRVLVTVKLLPRINVRGNQQLSIVSGNEYVVLTCTAFGDDIMGVYWERVDNGPLPFQNNMSSLSRDDTRRITLKLNITRARPIHSGRYRCIAYSKVGTAQSKRVTVTIKIAPPNVNIQPTNVTVEALRNATFTCEASGFEVTYKWKRHDDNNMIGNQSSLTISRATPSDEDQYYCVAMTEGGYAFSNNVTLIVDGSINIRIRTQPRNVTVNEDARGEGRSLLTYEWKKVGSDSLPDTASGGNSTELTITSVTSSDSGLYYCIVMNQWGTMVKSNNAIINVLSLPVITSSSHPISKGTITAADGDSVRLMCEATGNGTLTYQWRRVSESLPRSASVRINGQFLIIHRVTVTDGGQYYCVVSDNDGSMSSMRVLVIVKRLPIVNIPSNQQLSIVSGNEYVVLTCAVLGDDIMGVYWERVDNGPLPTQNNMSSLSTDQTRTITLKLNITRARPIHSGRYRCIAYSEVGTAQSKRVMVAIKIAPPNITKQPTDVTVKALQDATFSCEASGFEVKYEWKRHDNNSIIGRQSSLTISRATPLDEDQYYCVAMTEGGYAFSNNVTLIVNGSINIRIRTQPKDIAVSEGGTVVLSIDARGEGRGSFTYEWKKVGSDSLPDTASGGNSAELTITSVTSSDSGLYYCIVMNQWGTMMKSNNASVNVLYVTAHPKDTVVGMGRNVTLTCNASGADNVKYQWMRMGNKTIPSTATGVNSNTLVIPSIRVDDSGQYKCVVSSGDVNVMSEYGTVSVLALPVITRHPNSNGPITVAEDSDVRLTCEATGEGTLNYHWKKVSGSLPSSATMRRKQTLIIRNIVVKDSGQYYCEVDNGGRSVSSMRVQVTARRRPSITNIPNNEQLSILSGNEQVTLTCIVTGDDIAGGYWEKMNDDPLPVNNNRSSLSNDKRTLTITIRRARPTHSGMYRCVVYSQWGVAQSRNVQVTITIALPMITKQPTNQTITALQDVTFTCEAKGFEVEYEWKRHNGSVTGRRQSSLTISRATPLDEDQYYCVAMTKGGYAFSNNVTLTVNDGPLLIQRDPQNQIVNYNQKAIFECFVNGSSSSLTVTWERNRNQYNSGNVNNILHSNGVRSSYQATVRDSGKYRCRATNDNGSSTVSTEAELISGPLLIQRDPQNQIVNYNQKAIFECFVNGSGSSLTVTWERNRNQYNSGNMNNILHSNGVRSSLTINQATVRDSGKYRCRATNDNGSSTVSTEAELIIIPVILTNPSSVTVLITQQLQFACRALGTDIVYQWMKDDIIVSGVHSAMLNVTNITESDEGVYKCVASNKGGRVESHPATITVYSPPIIEELPQKLHVVLGKKLQITCTATNDHDAPMNLIFTWETPNSAYLSLIKTEEDESLTATSTLHISTVTQDHGGMYQCIVRNGEPLSANSSKVTTVIVEVQPSQPLAFGITHTDVTSLQLTWTEPENPNGRIDYYNVYYSNKSHSLSKQVTNDASYNGTYTLGNLRPYTEYNVYVTAVRLIEGDANRPLEGVISRTMIGRTLAGVPVIDYVNVSKIILNSESSTFDETFTIDLPAITLQHGLFSYVYITVVTDNVITNTESISTAMLLEESMKSHPLYYVAAVVNVSQYVLGKGLSYILGAGDNTTDINNQIFYNRKINNGYHYFFRIFSFDSTLENELYITTELQKIEVPQSRDPVENKSGQDSSTDGNNASVMAIAILAVLLVVLLISVIVLAIVVFKLKMKLQANDNSKSVQPSNAPEPTYEMIDKHDNVKLDKNPAYSVQDTSMNHNYDFIPESNQAKTEQ